MSSKFYTTRQLAEMFGTSTYRVAEWASKGVIKASKNRLGQWVIPESEIPKVKKHLETASEKETASKRSVVTPCPEAKEIEPDLYQCPRTGWLRVRKGAQICISCKRTHSS